MLELQSLACGYGQLRAVQSLSLALGEGEIFALLGANGAGKSSTIQCIAGHVAQQGGSVFFQQEEISGLPARLRARRGIALAPEGRRLFAELSVEENLLAGGYSQPKSLYKQHREEVLTLFPRLGERRRQAAGSLSGGEQQMLAIGRALMAQPRLLLIDELSLGLMPKVIDACYEALEVLRKQGLALLLVEQNTERALSIADRVCILESGRQVWMGDADTARRDPALVAAYLGTGDQ